MLSGLPLLFALLQNIVNFVSELRHQLRQLRGWVVGRTLLSGFRSQLLLGPRKTPLAFLVAYQLKCDF